MRFILLFLMLQLHTSAQNIPDKIKIKKEDYSLYFFQKGAKTDTISSQNNNLFVLKIGVSRRRNAIIEIENGRFETTKNDSIYKLVHMPGMNYRHLFGDSTTTEKSEKKTSPFACTVFKTQVNGSNASGHSKQIHITIKNNTGDSLYLSNKYYYR